MYQFFPESCRRAWNCHRVCNLNFTSSPTRSLTSGSLSSSLSSGLTSGLSSGLTRALTRNLTRGLTSLFSALVPVLVPVLIPVLVPVFVLVSLAGCATHVAGIGTRVLTCCATGQYETFSVSTRDMPAFLGPIMVSNFSVALASHGLNLNEDAADLDIVLRYEQENFSIDETSDDFAERVASGDSLRFLAKIIIEIRESGKAPIIWSGQLHRIHDVGPGEYMHTGRASVALLEAFTHVLKDFPRNDSR